MTYKKAFFLYVFIYILYFNSIFFRFYVIYPHNNDLEVTGKLQKDFYINNRTKFSDTSILFIPEINLYLNGNNKAWLSTWNPFVQLGRPMKHRSGFSKTYLISHIISLFINNPFIFYSIFTMITVFLTGLFFFLFLKELNIHPVACFIGTAGLTFSIYISYWLNFVMFISTPCWTLCLLWLITKFIKTPSYTIGAGMSFAIYSILLVGHVQAIVLSFYLIFFYTIISIYKLNKRLKEKIYCIFFLTVIVLSGIIMTIPNFLDLFIIAKNSLRLNTDDFFFLNVIPWESPRELCVFLCSIFDSFWIGNPILTNYPVQFNNLSFTSYYLTLFFVPILNGTWRKLMFWYIFAFICLIGSICPSFYLFFVHYMGFRFSRFSMMQGAIIPVFFICSHTIDILLRDRKSIKYVYLLLFPILIVTLLQLLIWNKELSIFVLKYIFLSYLTVFLTIYFIITRKTIIIYMLTIIYVFVYGYNLILSRPLYSIHISSPLIDFINKETKNSYRYVLVGNELDGILPSNQEGLLNIRSIHSYDSLSSRAYQEFALLLSESGTSVYGRYFYRIDSDEKLHNQNFIYTGINLVLSKEEVDKKIFKKIGNINEINFYKPLREPLLYAQFSDFNCSYDKKNVYIKGVPDKKIKVNQVLDYNDFKIFHTNNFSKETLLFLSQQYHSQWIARSKGKKLDTVIINDFYQGVIIPSHTEEIELEFKPIVLWSFLPQLIYLILLTIFLIRTNRRSPAKPMIPVN